jgi:hypothetical protein
MSWGDLLMYESDHNRRSGHYLYVVRSTLSMGWDPRGSFVPQQP